MDDTQDEPQYVLLDADQFEDLRRLLKDIRDGLSSIESMVAALKD